MLAKYMKIVEFGCYAAEFKEWESGCNFKVYAPYGEGGNITNIELNGIKLLKNSDDELSFMKGWFTYQFKFKPFTPGLEKMSFTNKLFHKIPFYGFRGEVGFKYKNELRAIIAKYS